MLELLTPGGIITNIIAFILADLLLRGIWAFINMGPDKSSDKPEKIKICFMIAYPTGIGSLTLAFALRDSFKYVSYALVLVSALAIMFTISFFFDALRHARKNEANRPACQDANKDDNK